MPTGYTAELMEKGQDFRTFVLQCARAFGACIAQRDDPMKELPKEQEPSSYSKKGLDEAIAEHSRLVAMDSDQRYEFGVEKKTKAITESAGYLQREKDQNKRLDDMMVEVIAWQPPTTEHAGLKAFMIEQITISRHSLAWAEKELDAATKKAPRQFYEEALAQAARSIEWRREEYAKELQRTDGRNEWIRKLYSSLP